MNAIPKVSIIIPVKQINDYIKEAIIYHMNLDYPDFEILIFPDELPEEMKKRNNCNHLSEKLYNSLYQNERVKIIASGEVGPAEKRDLSLKYAEGEIFAFIDDDAYPRADWLKEAVLELKNDDVGAVGGPAVTANGDDLYKQASGKIFESFLCSGGYVRRYLPRERREEDDIPSVNLIVKRDVFEKIGGYDSTFYPGEDTKLCMDIVNEGKRIIYTPKVLVYHHRRSVFKEHLKQATNYAKHRGYFAKKLPQTSLRITYFIPTLFVCGLIGGPIAALFFPLLWYVYGGILLLYFILAAVSLKGCNNYKLFLLSLVGIFATHIGYGICFVRGLLSKELLR